MAQQHSDTERDRSVGVSLTFAGSPLDRETARRRDHTWLEARLADTRSRFLPLWRLQPLVKRGDARALAWARRDFFADLDPSPEPVLLGSLGDVAHFAVDVSAAARPEESFGVGDVARFEDLRGVVPLLPLEEAAISAQARSLVDWHARHGFCAACGGATRAVCGGAHRVCRECQAEHFPRTDPVAIAIVVRGEQCLLGRQRGWPAAHVLGARGLRRGRRVARGGAATRGDGGGRRARRRGALLALATVALPELADARLRRRRRERGDPRGSAAELEDARWFSRDAVRRRSLAGGPGEPQIPPPFSIAHQLLRAWSDGALS